MGCFRARGARPLSVFALGLTLLAACGGQSQEQSDSSPSGGSLGSAGDPALASSSGGLQLGSAGDPALASGGGLQLGSGGVASVSIDWTGGNSAGGGAKSFAGEANLAGAGGEGTVDLGLGAGDLTVLVVFDKSGSMGEHWDQRTKWEVANEALMKAIVDVLDNLTIGTIFFPIPGGCDVDGLNSGTQMGFMSGRKFYDNWQATAETRKPVGGTPLELALRTADAAIQEANELGLLADRFRVVLVTDGEPSCSDNLEAIAALPAAWHELGVETSVMGLPGSSSAGALLDAIAAAGGTEKAQSLGDPSQLDQGFYTAVR